MLFYLEGLFLNTFSGFSIIYIGYVVMNILMNYPPREMGISP